MSVLKAPAVINHVIGMLIFFSIPLIFAYSQSNYSGAAALFLSPQYWLFILYYPGIYFFLTKIVVPKLYAKRKFAAAAIILVLLVSAVYIKPFDRLVHHGESGKHRREFNERPPLFSHHDPPASWPPGPEKKDHTQPPFDIISVFLLLMLFLIVIAIESVKRWRVTEQRAIQAEADHTRAELSFLKAQINPHFLFNTLNNIYSLAVTKNDKAPEAIMELSDIMRYVTDDVNEIMVPLESEISCIKNYINLQKLRSGPTVEIDFSIEGDITNITIPPLILMTFVENAFKHGISNHEQTAVIIKILKQEGYIGFFIQNSFFNRPANTERAGIGLENTKKRLQVLYPGKHVLTINKIDKLYIVELILYN